MWIYFCLICPFETTSERWSDSIWIRTVSTQSPHTYIKEIEMQKTLGGNRASFRTHPIPHHLIPYSCSRWCVSRKSDWLPTALPKFPVWLQGAEKGQEDQGHSLLPWPFSLLMSSLWVKVEAAKGCETLSTLNSFPSAAWLINDSALPPRPHQVMPAFCSGKPRHYCFAFCFFLICILLWFSVLLFRF